MRFGGESPLTFNCKHNLQSSDKRARNRCEKILLGCVIVTCASMFKRLTQKLRHAFCTSFACKAELALSQSFKHGSLHNLHSRNNRARNRGEKVPSGCELILNRLFNQGSSHNLHGCNKHTSDSRRKNTPWVQSRDKYARNRGAITLFEGGEITTLWVFLRQFCLLSSLFLLGSLFFISFSSFALDGVVFNGKLIVTENIYVCDKATGECYRTCRDGDTQPGCVDSCSARTINNCVLSDTNHNGTSGSCAPGYNKGSCSYRCNNGTWDEVSNSCRLHHGCSSSIYNNCARSSSSHGVSSGECIRGYTGNCSYRCDDGTWDERYNTCRRAGRSCSSETISNCDLSNTSHSSTSGSCAPGYNKGSCSYRCNDGTWDEVSNSCRLPLDCAHSVYNNCIRSFSGHGVSSGECVCGYTGSCSYRCDNGTWNEVSNSCVEDTETCHACLACYERKSESCCTKEISCKWLPASFKTRCWRKCYESGQFCYMHPDGYHCCFYCFKADTLITMADGTFKLIQDVRKGDKLLAADNKG